MQRIDVRALVEHEHLALRLLGGRRRRDQTGRRRLVPLIGAGVPHGARPTTRRRRSRAFSRATAKNCRRNGNLIFLMSGERLVTRSRRRGREFRLRFGFATRFQREPIFARVHYRRRAVALPTRASQRDPIRKRSVIRPRILLIPPPRRHKRGNGVLRRDGRPVESGEINR